MSRKPLVKGKVDPEFTALMVDLQKLEQRAADQGLWITKRVINSAQRAAGWELSGDLTQAVQRALDGIDPNGAP